MHDAVAPPYGGRQSSYGPPLLRCPSRHFWMHFPFAWTNFTSACDVPASHLSSSLPAGICRALGCEWACRTMDTGSVLDGQFGTLSAAVNPSRDVFSSRMVSVGGLAAGRKTSAAVMNGSEK